MSVYKREKAKTYSYDFQFGGIRFSGDTGKSSKREAEAAEKTEREIAKKQIEVSKQFISPDMTFEVAASRYWTEAGQFQKRTDGVLWSLTWLKKELGPKTSLSKIDDNLVSIIVAKRRLDKDPRFKNQTTAPYITNRTVNTTVKKFLRTLLKRAKKNWKVNVGEVNWENHLLSVSQDRVREATAHEEQSIYAELDRGFEDAIEFSFLTGVRRMEILGLKWENVDFFGRRFTVLGKGDKFRQIPMTKKVYDILWRQQGHHSAAVFTFEASKNSARYGYVKGMRYPMTDNGLKTTMRRATKRAKVKDFHFHDTRHTAASRVLRGNGSNKGNNLKVVKDLLGHESIKTTDKYSHVQEDDILAGLEGASPTAHTSPTPNRLKNNK